MNILHMHVTRSNHLAERRAPAVPDGFARLDAVAILSALTALALVVLPALAGNRSRSSQAICANNLRQIGMGFHQWGNDFNDRPHWELGNPPGSAGDGGLSVNAWYHFAIISNELSSARLLLCPSDSGRRAEDFSANAAGGYLHPNYQNSATSYLLSHTVSGRPDNLMLADRNIGTEPGSVACSRFPVVQRVQVVPLSTAFRWDTNLHVNAGNVLTFDGAVSQLTTEALRARFGMAPQFDDFASLHFLKPR